MPPAILWAIKAVGSAAFFKLLAVAARKANAELKEVRRERNGERPVVDLERDPQTGEYRPRKS